MANEMINQQKYLEWATFISNKIKIAQTKAVFKVNEEMLTLYWEIGNSILEHQRLNGWGSKIIEHLAIDLKKHFVENSGFSARNLKYMKSFAEAYPEYPIMQVPLAQSKDEFVQVSLAQITWYHHGVATYELEKLVKDILG